jgi:membrane protein
MAHSHVHPHPTAAHPGTAARAEATGESRLARWRRKFRVIWKEIWDDEIFDRAAGLSYYFIFALFPMLLFITTLVGMFRLDIMQMLMDVLDQVLPTDVVHRTMTEVMKHSSGGLLSLGIAATLWSASSGMSALMGAINVAYDLKDHRPWWKRQLLALGLTVGAATMILAGMLLVMFGDRIEQAVAGWSDIGPVLALIWSYGRWVMIVVLIDWGMNLTYYFSLSRRSPWRWLTPGSTFAVGAWLLMSLAVRWALQTFMNLGTTYGSIGGVIGLLLWLYYTGVIILIGAEIDNEIGRDWSGVPATL